MTAPKVIKVKDLLQNENLQIPEYQRPYKWTTKNVNQLIDDMLLFKEKSTYRLGTLVIHEEIKNNKYLLNIVDGQQRVLTLTLIAFAIIQNHKDILGKILTRDENMDNYIPKLLLFTFSSDISKANIQNNYKEIERRISEFDEKTISFFFNRCELVQVVLTNVSEAFQFFDSQNSRGKDLEPHDLLKAFHLREMNNISTETEKREIVEKWEAMDTANLSKLFALYLYRIRNWSKGLSAKYFSKNDIDLFKGVSSDIDEDYPFVKMFRIVHYYTEDYNKSVHKKINQNNINYPFQIDQIIINGKRFFEMIAHYDKMINALKSREDIKILEVIKNYDGSNRTGDKYIRNLFYCGLVYYVDKFGEKDLEKAINKIFIWAYTLRLKLYSVGLDSIDNYALNKAHSLTQLFKKIREAVNPNEILNLKLDTVKDIKSSKTDKIEELFEGLRYYVRKN